MLYCSQVSMAQVPSLHTVVCGYTLLHVDKDYELKVKSHDQEKFQAKLDFESYKVLRVYCVVSLPEDREVFVRSMTARITVSTGEGGRREEGGKEGRKVGWWEGRKEGRKERVREWKR